MGEYKYKAFISYSHQDDRWGRWLHRRLENYPIPKNIIGKITPAGAIPKRLNPIFRDREDLAAADDLSVKIEKALSQSENLIVICSPAAARSHWVNQEILYFKRLNRSAQIFSVIAEGEPFASNILGRESEECFPPALRFELDSDGRLSDTPAEPLAADLRDTADGKRLGLLKLVSGMIGVGLDEIVQRDMKRGRRRVTAITSGALATVLAMGTLTGFALDARQDAEQRRKGAEGLVDFMLTDLRDKLKPVGRLDILEDVANHSLGYFEDEENKSLSCQGASAKSRALYVQAGVHMEKNQVALAHERATKALFTLREHQTACKDNPQFIVNYAHALQWDSVTELNLTKNELPETLSCDAAFQAADVLPESDSKIMKRYHAAKDAIRMLKAHSDWKTEYLLEMSDADILIGVMYLKSSACNSAYDTFKGALDRLSEQLENDQIINDARIVDKHADIATWIAETYERQADFSNASMYYELAQKSYTQLVKNDVGEIVNWEAYYAALGANYSRARVFYNRGNPATAIQILMELQTQVLLLVKTDPENEKWTAFKSKIEETLNKLNTALPKGN